jgi:hypothetical protein
MFFAEIVVLIPISAAVAQTLDDRADQRVHDRLQTDAALEFFGDQRQRRACRLANAEREVAGLASHGDDEIPPRRRLRVDHEVLHDLDAVVTRGLEAEGVHVGRQVQIVVDRLGHVRDADAPLRLRFELHRRVLEQLRIGRRVRARDADEGPAAEVNPAHLVDAERHDVLGVATHDPLEPFANAEDVDVCELAADGGRADDAIDAWGGASADENGQSFRFGHGSRL